VKSQTVAEVVERVLAELHEGEAAQARARGSNGTPPRPFVTLAWAQSLDGSIALEAGKRFAVSGEDSLALTHALRAAHDAIAIGVGTVIADDPALTVRLWNGKSPRPVVLDSQLRTPSAARLLNGDNARSLRIACTSAAGPEGWARLQARGVEVLSMPATENGWVDPRALLTALGAAGVRRVMVEGGARVLTSFLRASLGDFAVVTVAPILLGGLSAVGSLGPCSFPRPPRMHPASTHRLGDDWILSGRLSFQPTESEQEVAARPAWGSV
jgi:GTP cyclohydrolase II